MPNNLPSYKIQAASKLLELSAQQVRRLTDESGIEIETISSGSAKVRTYKPENLFDLAAFKRAKSKARFNRKLAVIYTPKGGVGKTTIASNMGIIFALLGLRTLLVDIDFQSNLTLALGYDSDLDETDARERGLPLSEIVQDSFGDLVRSDRGLTLKDVIKMPYGPNGPHLVPSDVNLNEFDSWLMVKRLSGKTQPIAEWIMQMLASETPGNNLADYDIILFDSSPNKSLITEGVLLAADYVIAPVSLDNFARKGLSYLSDVLHQLRTDYGRNPELILQPNFYNQRLFRTGKQVDLLARDYQANLMEETIRASEDFPRALSDANQNIPIVFSKPTAPPVEDLFSVAHSLLKRMGVVQGDA